jgi:hypothetical protein
MWIIRARCEDGSVFAQVIPFEDGLAIAWCDDWNDPCISEFTSEREAKDVCCHIRSRKSQLFFNPTAIWRESW